MTSEMLECDVLIVGGGPAGLSVASGLPKEISSIVVHQDSEIGKPVRTSGGCWLSDAQRLGIPAKFYQIVDHLDVFSDTQSAHFKIQNDKLIVLDITGLYQWLATKSDSHNRQLLTATKFLTTEMSKDGRYISTVRSRELNVTTIKSKFIIDASGVRNAALQSLDIKQKPTRTGVGIEYEYPIGTNRSDRAILFVGSSVLSGYGWVFPTSDGKLRVGVGVIHPDVDMSPKTLIQNFLSSPDIQRFGLELGSDFEVNAGSLPSIAYDPKLVYGNVIRVGDSANFATPTVGEGIRICMELGHELGVALGQSIHGKTQQPLKRYEARCTKELRRNYWFGYLANQRFSNYSADDWDKSIRRVSRLNDHELVALLRSEFSFQMIFKAALKTLQQKILTIFR